MDAFLIPASPSTSVSSAGVAAGIDSENSDHERDNMNSDFEPEVEDLNTAAQVKSSQAPRKGKAKDPVWKFFNSITTKTGRSYQKCIDCGTLVSAQAQRLKKHKLKCNGIRKDQDSALKGYSSSSSQDSLTTESKIRRVQPKIYGLAQRTSEKEKQYLDRKVARFWYGANLSFNTAHLEVWKSLCTSLRPGYLPPTRRQLEGSLLDETYETLLLEMKSDLNGKIGTLVQDGWSDIHNYPVLTHTLVCNGEAYLINSIECKANKKTAEYCAEQFEKTLLELKHQWKFSVISGTTDNTASMVKMRRILHEKYTDLLFYGCSPHMMNLLCADVSCKTLVGKINEVSKFFREHHEPAAKLKEMNGIRPQIPAGTRWISHLDCIRVFLKNRTKYIELTEICKSSVAEIVNSLEIYRDTQQLLLQMEEISAEILKLQSDKCNVADAAHSWLKLFNSDCLLKYQEQVAKRMETACEDFFFVAYLLHPRYKGMYLDQRRKNACFDYLLNKSPKFVPVAQAFLAKDTAVFPASLLKEEVLSIADPVNWWLSISGGETVPKELVDLLVPMYRSPASSASVERTFSTYGFVQTEKRNRLNQEKVMKLSFCLRWLRRNETGPTHRRNVLSQSEAQETDSEDEDDISTLIEVD